MKTKAPHPVKRAPRAQTIATDNTTIKGWRALTLENENLKAVVLPEYGGLIYSIYHKPRQTEMLWQSARGLLAKDDPPVVPESSLGFRATSPGCWPELFPHGSSPAEVYGVRMPFHGEGLADGVYRTFQRWIQYSNRDDGALTDFV